MLRKRIGEIYTPNVIDVHPDTPTVEAIRVMHAKHISCILVTESSKPIGIFTERNIVHAAARFGPEFSSFPIKDLMSSPVLTAPTQMHVFEAYNLLREKQVRHLVIVNEFGRTQGVITQSNLIEPLGLEHFVEVRKLSQIMMRHVIDVAPDTQVIDALALMAQDKISCLVVTVNKTPIGILTERDVSKILCNGVLLKPTTVENIMSHPVLTAPTDMPVHEAMSKMKRKNIRRLVVIDRKGRLLGLITQSDIISSLKARYIDILKELIREKEEKYRSIFENSSLGILRATLEGQVLVANPALVRMLGYEHPVEISDAVHSISKQIYEDPVRRENIIRSIQNPAGVKFESKLTRKDGKVLTTQTTLRCSTERYSCAKFLEMFIDDVTERKDAELDIIKRRDMLEELVKERTKELNKINEQLQTEVRERRQAEEALAELNRQLEDLVKDRTRELVDKTLSLEEANKRLTKLNSMKSSFLSSVSHELRTPLTSVMGFAKLIQRDLSRVMLTPDKTLFNFKGSPERIKSNLDIIIKESERLTLMINDVLDLSKIESGKMEWRDSEVHIPKIIERAVNSLDIILREKSGVELAVDIPSDLPKGRFDSDRILQVLINLLNNAAKFTEEGEIRISAMQPDPDSIRVSVADTGIGIPETDLRMIFEKFHQAFNSSILNNKLKGTGLGLAICRQIIEHYGGAIWAESEFGRGSVFHFELPVIQD